MWKKAQKIAILMPIITSKTVYAKVKNMLNSTLFVLFFLLSLSPITLYSAEKINFEDIAVHALCLMGKQAPQPGSDLTSAFAHTANQPFMQTNIISPQPTTQKKKEKTSGRKSFTCVECIDNLILNSKQIERKQVRFSDYRKEMDCPLIETELFLQYTFTKQGAYFAHLCNKKHMVEGMAQPPVPKCSSCNRKLSTRAKAISHFECYHVIKK